MLDEVEARTAHARRVEPLQFFVGDVRLHHRDAAIEALAPFQRIHERGIVRAVATRLYDHRALKAQMIVQFAQLFLRRIDGRVGARRGEGERRRRAEDVAMGIDGTRRQRDVRLLRVRVKGEVFCTHIRAGSLEERDLEER